MWGVIYLYAGLLLALAAVVTWKGSGPMKRTVWTLVGVWAIQFAFASALAATSSLAHAFFMLAIDTTACVLITWHPAGRWQSVIGLSFILQIGAHIGRIASELFRQHTDINLYWWALTLLAFLQLFLLGGWWIHGRYSHYRGGRYHLQAAPARFQSLEK